MSDPDQARPRRKWHRPAGSGRVVWGGPRAPCCCPERPQQTMDMTRKFPRKVTKVRWRPISGFSQC